MGKRKIVSERDLELEQILLPSENQTLAVATKLLGAGFVQVLTVDGKEMTCRIKGKLRRKVWIKAGDVVLVERWPFGPGDKGDILWRYTKNQAIWLKENGYLPDWVNV